jgi:branched-chain amino acid transport system ATP-binding protein
MLRAQGLHKRFGALKVTDGVSLHVPAGSRHAIIGPNGAGKTTLFNLLAGALRPDAGRIELDGADVTRLPPHRRARLGLARSFQRNSLFPGETVRGNLLLADIAARGTGTQLWRRLDRMRESHARVEALAERIGLAAMLERPASTLAYGVQRQLELGLALIAQPKLLLLDEPTAGMGPGETGRMLELIDALPRELTVVLIEHDMSLVFDHAERITVLHQGGVLMEGTAEQVRASPVVRETYLGGPC